MRVRSLYRKNIRQWFRKPGAPPSRPTPPGGNTLPELPITCGRRKVPTVGVTPSFGQNRRSNSIPIGQGARRLPSPFSLWFGFSLGPRPSRALRRDFATDLQPTQDLVTKGHSTRRNGCLHFRSLLAKTFGSCSRRPSDPAREDFRSLLAKTFGAPRKSSEFEYFVVEHPGFAGLMSWLGPQTGLHGRPDRSRSFNREIRKIREKERSENW